MAAAASSSFSSSFTTAAFSTFSPIPFTHLEGDKRLEFSSEFRYNVNRRYHRQDLLNERTKSSASLSSRTRKRHRHGNTVQFSSPPSSSSSSSSETTTPNSSPPPSSSLTPPYDPSNLFNGTIPYPKSLSPSSASEFRKCPQSYLFQYLYGIRQPANAALAKGSLCHTALEELFNLQPHQRTITNLQNLFREAWRKERSTEKYSHLFEVEKEQSKEHDDGSDDKQVKWDEKAEIAWGKSALQLLANYMDLEDPRNIPRPNPLEREVWVNAHLTVDPKKGVTGYAHRDKVQERGYSLLDGSTHEDGGEDSSKFLVRGIVDRVDMIRIKDDDNHNNNNNIVLRIVDYKTGKAPNFKYSAATNERIAHENFWQLKVYALLIKEMVAAGKGPMNLKSMGASLRMLRLLYLTSEDDEGVYLDMDLGETERERDDLLQEVHGDLASIWVDIKELVDRQDPKAFVHCDKPYCFCHTLRPQFVKGTVWEREGP